jgi:RND family efflux transporter MFP subunit
MKNIVVLLIAFLFASCGSPEQQNDDAATAADPGILSLTEEERAAMDLAFADVTLAEAQKTISVPARVIEDPDQVATVSALIDGRIGRVLVKQGQRVAAEQVLATVVSMELGNIIAELLRSESELLTSNAAVKRSRELAASDAASNKQLQDAEHAFISAQAAAAAALQRCKAAGMNTKDIEALRANPQTFEPELKLRAPIGGVISMRNASTGMPVSPGAELFTILNQQNATIEGSVFEDDFSILSPNQPATFYSTAYPDKTFKGTLSFIAPTVDNASHALPVRVRVANVGGALRPNLYGRLDILTDTRDSVLTVPAEALVYDGSDRFLFIVAGENSYAYRRVETGREFDNSIEVTKGVHVGERVVSSGVFHLKSRYKLSLEAEEE